MPLIFQDGNLIAGTGDIARWYQAFLPFTHESLAAWWIQDPSGTAFTDDDGNIYYLRKRTLAELQATPEYQVWIGANPSMLPKLYVTLDISGGDGSNPPGINLSNPEQNSLTLTGNIRLDPSNPATTLPIDKSWRFTIRKIISEQDYQKNIRLGKDPTFVGSTVKNIFLANGQVQYTLTMNTREEGVWLISDADFDIIRAADFPQFGLTSDYQVLLVGGDHFFKVY